MISYQSATYSLDNRSFGLKNVRKQEKKVPNYTKKQQIFTLVELQQLNSRQNEFPVRQRVHESADCFSSSEFTVTLKLTGAY